jgi:hypothetical protein
LIERADFDQVPVRIGNAASHSWTPRSRLSLIALLSLRQQVIQADDSAALAFIVAQHFVNLLLIVTGNAVR